MDDSAARPQVDSEDQTVLRLAREGAFRPCEGYRSHAQTAPRAGRTFRPARLVGRPGALLLYSSGRDRGRHPRAKQTRNSPHVSIKSNRGNGAIPFPSDAAVDARVRVAESDPDI